MILPLPAGSRPSERQGKLLIPAEQYIPSGNTKEFYGLITKVLRDYFANKWHQSSAALSMDVILKRLKTAKANEALIAQLKTLLEQSWIWSVSLGPNAVQLICALDLGQVQGPDR